MRSINNLSSLAELDDDELVTRSLAGDVEAFRQIGVRYYPLISALAYHATGSLSQSDNLAQDTLVAAWKQLADLPAPAKLRSWLCGIAHQLIKDFLCDKGAGQAPSCGGKAALTFHCSHGQNAVERSDYGLSAREKEVVELMSKDLIKKEIAERLGLSYHTVNNHLRSIYEKLQVHTRSGAVAKALGEELL
jgi:DNA-binding CsgD family transcriptional regulator